MKHQYKLGNAKINFETAILTWNHDKSFGTMFKSDQREQQLIWKLGSVNRIGKWKGQM